MSMFFDFVISSSILFIYPVLKVYSVQKFRRKREDEDRLCLMWMFLCIISVTRFDAFFMTCMNDGYARIALWMISVLKAQYDPYLSLCSWTFYLWWDFYDSQIEGRFDCFYFWAGVGPVR